MLLIPGVSLHAETCLTAADFDVGDTLLGVRNSVRLEARYTRQVDGTVTEQRRTFRDGSVQNIEVEYADGIWALSRTDEKNQLALELGAGLVGHGRLPDAFDPTKIGNKIEVPIKLLSKGQEIDTGMFKATVAKKTTLVIGTCQYDVFVVRRTTALKKAGLINNETFYEPNLGLSIGSLAMTKDWTPRSSVFFDSLIAE